MTENIQISIDDDGIAHVVWDMPGRSMNVLSDDSIREYVAVIDRIVIDTSVKGAVITSGKKDFIAGADLNMLEAMSERALGQDPVAAAEDIFNDLMVFQMALRRLETAGKPIACAIPGTALGGGLEVALATHYRVVADNPKAQLGLPECKVGLMPGSGGTQRVARLLGAMAAAPIILEGRSVDPNKALALGLVQERVAQGTERDAATKWVKTNISEGESVSTARANGEKAEASFDPPWDKKGYKIPGGGPYTPQGFPIFMGAGAMVRKSTYGLYEAQKAILSAVYEGLQVPMDIGLRIEMRYFTKLMCNPQSRNMIRSLFVNKQALEKRCAAAVRCSRQIRQKTGRCGWRRLHGRRDCKRGGCIGYRRCRDRQGRRSRITRTRARRKTSRGTGQKGPDERG